MRLMKLLAVLVFFWGPVVMGKTSVEGFCSHNVNGQVQKITEKSQKRCFGGCIGNPSCSEVKYLKSHDCQTKTVEGRQKVVCQEVEKMDRMALSNYFALKSLKNEMATGAKEPKVVKAACNNETDKYMADKTLQSSSGLVPRIHTEGEAEYVLVSFERGGKKKAGEMCNYRAVPVADFQKLADRLSKTGTASVWDAKVIPAAGSEQKGGH